MDPRAVIFTRQFQKMYRKADSKIQLAFDQRIDIFLRDNSATVLHNHALTGEYLGFRSINITGNWRAVYSEAVDDGGDIITTFDLLGTHSQLYK